MNNLSLYIARPAQQTAPPLSPTPSQPEEPSLPLDSDTPPQETLPESALASAQEPHEIQELSDDRYYPRHWGINE